MVKVAVSVAQRGGEIEPDGKWGSQLNVYTSRRAKTHANVHAAMRMDSSRQYCIV
jgi:hypothetical protein